MNLGKRTQKRIGEVKISIDIVIKMKENINKT